MTQNDYDDIQRCIFGDRNAFRPIVERYQNVVFNTVVRMVFDVESARDIVQETFVKAYTKLNTFDSRFPFRVWLLRIAVNSAIDYIRKIKSNVIRIDAPDDDPESNSVMQIPSMDPLPDDLVAKLELSEQVRAAVCQLDPKLRSVIVLRHFQELEYEEIAEVMNIPIGSVKNRLFRARERLQELLLTQKTPKER